MQGWLLLLTCVWVWVCVHRFRQWRNKHWATNSDFIRYICRMRILICLICLFGVGLLQGQQPDSVAPVVRPDTLRPALDTARLQAASGTSTKPRKPGLVRRIFTKNYPNPKTAAFLSLALPGTGQIYNRKWWKLPIVYAVLGGLTYIEIDNINEYRRLRDNYRYLVDDDPNTNPTESPYNLLDATSMKQYRDQWRRYVEQSSIALGLAYILTATEAFVDAHLTQFDVSDDLSFRLRPDVQAAPFSGISYGVGLRIRIGNVQSRSAPPQNGIIKP